MATDDKSTLVQMRLQPATIERINRLSEITNASNKTQLISSSIQLTEELLKTIQNGGKIYIENADGTKESIKIVI